MPLWSGQYGQSPSGAALQNGVRAVPGSSQSETGHAQPERFSSGAVSPRAGMHLSSWSGRGWGRRVIVLIARQLWPAPVLFFCSRAWARSSAREAPGPGAGKRRLGPILPRKRNPSVRAFCFALSRVTGRPSVRDSSSAVSAALNPRAIISRRRCTGFRGSAHSGSVWVAASMCWEHGAPMPGRARC